MAQHDPKRDQIPGTHPFVDAMNAPTVIERVEALLLKTGAELGPDADPAREGRVCDLAACLNDLEQIRDRRKAHEQATVKASAATAAKAARYDQLNEVAQRVVQAVTENHLTADDFPDRFEALGKAIQALHIVLMANAVEAER